MGRTTANISRPGFLVDLNAYDQDGGHQIDWAEVGSGFADASGRKRIPAGTAMNIQSDGTLIPRSGTAAAHCLLISDAEEGNPVHAKTGYGIVRSGVVFEDLLPDATNGTLAAAVKTELNAQGRGFDFVRYSDSREA